MNIEPRATPNPNVLVELGYALRALGDEQVVLVSNLAHGELAHVPFDLRQHKILSYTCGMDDDKAAVRKVLSANFESHLQAIFALKPRNQLDVRVLVQRGFLSSGGLHAVPIVLVEVQNHSPSTVFLGSVQFLLADNRFFFPREGLEGLNCPVALQAGDSHTLHFHEAQLSQWVRANRIVAAVAKDKIDRLWLSDRAAFARVVEGLGGA